MNNPVEIFEDMKLQVVVKTTAACTVLVRGRYWHDNQVKFFTETLTPDVLTGAVNTFTPIQFPQGKLLNIDVSTPTPNIQRGQLAVSCGLLLQGQASNPFIRLMSGYVTTFKGIDLSSGFEDLLSGRGYIGLINIPNSEPGNYLLFSSAYVMLKIFSLKLTAHADAGGSGMTPLVIMYDSSPAVSPFAFEAKCATPAGSSYDYYFLPNYQFRDSAPSATMVVSTIPQELILGSLSLEVRGVGPDDYYGENYVYAEQWIYS